MLCAATWMDLEIIILSEVRQRQILYDITSMWNLIKNNTKELIYKTETNSQISKLHLALAKGKLGGGLIWEDGL